jgi:hypothetical protein
VQHRIRFLVLWPFLGYDPLLPYAVYLPPPTPCDLPPAALDRQLWTVNLFHYRKFSTSMRSLPA